MKAFYSIIYCTLRSNIEERITIGLFFGDDKKCFFDFSSEKAGFIKPLLTDNSFSLLKTSLKSLQRLTDSQDCQPYKEDIFSKTSSRTTLGKEQLFAYLSQYSNNLITFSYPVPIDLEVSKMNFEKLFQKFVFPITEVKGQKPIEIARKRLALSIKDNVNWEIELDNKVIPGLVIPAKVLFIGKNDVQVTGDAKDFSNHNLGILKQQINAHFHLVDKIKQSPNGKNAHFFFIGDEPPKAQFENHSLWKAVKDSKTFDIVASDDVGVIENYMRKHGVEPLLPA